MGADAVSMSMVLEAAFAHYLGMRVLGLGLVTNQAGDSGGTSHEQVLAAASEALPDVIEFLSAAIGELNW
jgi:purine nucleoside phosphorylase